MPLDTKTILLEAAEDAARTRGYDAFSFADLAQAAQIRKASVHHHFPTKAALATAVMKHYQDKVVARLAMIDKRNARASDRLAAFLALYREALGTGDRLCLCVALSTSHSSLPEEANARMVAFRSRILAWLETAFALGATDRSIRLMGYPQQEAPALLALVEGAQLAARTARDPRVFDTATAFFRQRLA